MESAPLFFESEAAIDCFLEAWLTGQLEPKRWTHAAHVAVAAQYAFSHSHRQTYELMRSGLLRFNEYTGTPNSDTRGYHETLTRFWAYTIWLFVHSEVPVSRLDAVRSAISEFGGDTKLPDRHYGRNLTTDVIARRSWIPPNDAFARAVSFFDDLLAAVLAIVPIPERTKSAAERIRLQGDFRWVRLYELQSREIELVASSGDDDDLFVPDVYDVPSELVGQVLDSSRRLVGLILAEDRTGEARKAEQQAMLQQCAATIACLFSRGEPLK